MSIKRRYWLRKGEVKHLAAEVEKFGLRDVMKKRVEVLELEDGSEIILVEGKGLLVRLREGIFPTLPWVDTKLRRVVVDMGAVPHVANGADVMAPGVVSADPQINGGDPVVVVDERHGKALAVGIALVPGAEMKAPKGKVVKNVHHVGDKVWRFVQLSGISGSRGS